ncbi:MAG: phenylalanine--tRNA ligase subunit alpha [Chloroflexi bacterium]|nr:phenylalanine--tRNA ligase subunit alpha [Chloroflexota bacterium]
MLEKLEALHHEAHEALDGVNDSASLRDWEGKYLGKKGAITEIMRSVGGLPKEERADFGKRANEIKQHLTVAFEAQEKQVKAQELSANLQSGAIDVSLPGRPHPVGGLHPSTQMLRNFYAIWADMGFQVYRSRDVEDDDTNFTLLNIPPHHPARDMWDTFHTTTPGVILRTHTSPGQIRSMREYGENGTQPIRVILPGMCYRYEQTSVRSEIQFNQVEGVCIGKNIHMTDLKGTVTEFARRMFSPDTKVRFRSSYFPFTEPSMEVDAECLICHGEGCAMCKYSGWLEIAGCGMMHPVVLRNGGYDPEVWSGFAFGMGPERMINLKYGVADIRYYWGNDLRFLEQF